MQFLLVLLLSMGFATLSFAQRQTGSLAGKVVDEKTSLFPAGQSRFQDSVFWEYRLLLLPKLDHTDFQRFHQVQVILSLVNCPALVRSFRRVS